MQHNILHAIDAILFDMDGTLVDSTAAVERSWTRWAQRHGLSAAYVISLCHGRRAADTIAEVAPHLPLDEEAAALLAYELEQTEGLFAVPGAAALLARLEPTRWALVTSATEELARHRFACAGLPWPQVAVTAEQVRRGKPDPEGYLLAATHLGCAPARCLVVEDTRAGLEAGERAGMRVLGVTTTFSADVLRVAHVVPHFEDVAVRGDDSLSLHLAAVTS
ncbi:MAG TPA: HAD-IA family hydrolase [Myxococcota bacterium]|nr:HAD-IA family hydrolase [Myxococcota bacterium]